MASQDTLNQINSLMSQYQSMAPTNAADVTRDFMSRVANFMPQYQELANLEKSAYSAPADIMAQYQQQFGTDTGPDSFTRLSNAMNTIGTRMGTANALGNAISTARGRIEDLANTTLGQYNAMRQNLMDQMNPLQNIYQAQLQNEMDQRRLNASMSANAPQPAPAFPAFPGMPTPTKTTKPITQSPLLMNAYNTLKGINKYLPGGVANILPFMRTVANTFKANPLPTPTYATPTAPRTSGALNIGALIPTQRVY